MEPINYLAQVADPFAQATQGLKLGAGMADLQRQQEARAAQQQQAQLAAQEQARFFANPKPTMRDAARFASLLSPEQANAFRPYMEGITKEQQQGTLRRTGQLLSSLQLNPAIAVDRLNQEAEAANNSGDAEEAAFFTRLATAAADPAQGPSVAFKALVQSASGIPGAKDMFDTIDKGMSTARAEAQAPAELRQKNAVAGKAESDAQIRAEEARNIAAVIKADLEKKAADLGLTKAQTGSALAQSKKLGVETAKAVLELEALKASGGVDPAKTFDQEEKLRKEFQTRTKTYQDVNQTYQTLKASSNAKSGPGDIALITGFMKMLDPGSVVRETEFATARDTAGLYTRLENSLQKVNNGEFLKPAQRDEFVKLANEYYKAAQNKADEDKRALGVVVKNYKLNPENVFGAEAAPATPSSLPASATVGGKTYSRPASFTDVQWRDYLKANGVIQ
jgi:hypothetical protein